MTKFKIGDRVKVIGDDYRFYTPGSKYNLPRTVGTVVECGGSYIQVDYDGVVSPPVNPSSFELIVEKTHLPLYSEEIAMSFLQEKGYTVTPPSPKLSGKLYVYKASSGGAYGYPEKVSDILNWSLLAVVDWTEGDGLTEKVTEPDGSF